MGTTELAMPDVGVEKNGTELLAAANAIVVNDDASRRLADGLVIRIHEDIKQVHKAHDKLVALAHQGHKKAVAHREAYLGPLELAKRIVAGKLVADQEEVEREHRKEQARLQAIAREHAVQEQLNQAIGLEAEGRKAEAEAVIEAPVVVPVMAIPPPPTSDAISVRKDWSAKVTDEDALPRRWLMPNQKALDAHARVTKGSIAIPGVEFKCELRPASKPRR